MIPSRPESQQAALQVINAELVGNYALRVFFSDGHDTGIYSWSYLLSIDPENPVEEGS